MIFKKVFSIVMVLTAGILKLLNKNKDLEDLNYVEYVCDIKADFRRI